MISARLKKYDLRTIFLRSKSLVYWPTAKYLKLYYSTNWILNGAALRNAVRSFEVITFINISCRLT